MIKKWANMFKLASKEPIEIRSGDESGREKDQVKIP